MFKRNKKKIGCETPKYSYTTPPPPPTSESNAHKPNPNYVPPASVKKPCPYETPCGWCSKWDKKCDKKIGCGHNGDVGKKGMIGICPNCGCSGCISWNPDTDVSTCSCGWNNDRPKRGLRANANMYDDAMDPALKDIISGKGLSRLDTNIDPDKPLPPGIRKEIRG